MARALRKVAVVPAAGGLHAVEIDGQPGVTPGGAPLRLPSRAAAQAVAAEWAAQGERVLPATMPQTRLANTAIDGVAPRRAAVIAAVAAYGGTDLLCYRAERPAALVERQRIAWQPLVDWARVTFDAPLVVTTGIVPVAQPREALTGLAATVAALDDFTLTGLQAATALLGSLILGLALQRDRIDAGSALTVALVDETYQQEAWGIVEEAAGRRRALEAEIQATAAFFALLRRGDDAPASRRGGPTL